MTVLNKMVDGVAVPLSADEIAAREALAAAQAAAESAFVPTVVTMAQARIALSRAGKLADVEAAVTAAGGETKIWWDYATEVHRANPLVAQLGAAVGLASGDIDALFRVAKTVT